MARWKRPVRREHKHGRNGTLRFQESCAGGTPPTPVSCNQARKGATGGQMAQRRKLVSSHAGSFVQDQDAGCKCWACGLSTTPFASLFRCGSHAMSAGHQSSDPAPVPPSLWEQWAGMEEEEVVLPPHPPPPPQAGQSEAGIVGVKPMVLNPACSTGNSSHFLPSWAPLRANVGSANCTFPRGTKEPFCWREHKRPRTPGLGSRPTKALGLAEECQARLGAKVPSVWLVLGIQKGPGSAASAAEGARREEGAGGQQLLPSLDLQVKNETHLCCRTGGRGRLLFIVSPHPCAPLKQRGRFPGFTPFPPWKTLKQAYFPQLPPPPGREPASGSPSNHQASEAASASNHQAASQREEVPAVPLRAAQCLWDHPPKQPPPTWLPSSSVLISWRLEPHPEASWWGGTIGQRILTHLVGDPTKPSYAATELG